MQVKPITPHEAGAEPPYWVLAALNHLIGKGWKGDHSIVHLGDVVSALGGHYDSKFLAFEDTYRAAGWKVEYHAPAIHEPYNPYWIFSA